VTGRWLRESGVEARYRAQIAKAAKFAAEN